MTTATSDTFNIQATTETPFPLYTHILPNGLKLLMSVNKNEPRVFTNIAFRAGSKLDPKDTTGLAHYMEHMLFKGSDKIGTLNWKKEKELLDQIAQKFEERRVTTDEAERTRLYEEIDALSTEAAQFAAANEYDKILSIMGAEHTNAYTWVEQTVYVNDIPSNELERWMELESERFRKLALRLFHTELETVYEEFNIGQDSDFRKVSKAIRKELFPNHPYGTQTTIGEAEHLKNPSMTKIQEFFETYYVSNNMAIILSGDINPDEVIRLADKYFGDFKPNESMPKFTFEDQPARNEPVKTEVIGKDSPWVQIGWRFAGTQTNDYMWLNLFNAILYNGQAGLFDIHLNQQQEVLNAACWAQLHEDYTAFFLRGEPRDGQSIEEVETLLLREIQRMKDGDFDDELIKAVIKDMKKSEIKGFETNAPRVNLLTNLYVTRFAWEQYQNKYEFYEKLTKADIIAKAKSAFGNDYVVAYKRQGEDDNVVKVDKPPITAIELNKDVYSDFAQQFLNQEVPEMDPVFADYDQLIQHRNLVKGVNFDYVHNEQNELFTLNFIFEMGVNSNLKYGIAFDYLPYLGTSKYSPQEFQMKMYSLGLSLNTTTYDERMYITLSGLDESLEEGLELMKHLMEDAQPNEMALQNVVSDILQRRENDKSEKGVILRQALASYAKYGADNSFKYRLTPEQLQSLQGKEMIELMNSILDFEHTIYYYGSRDLDNVAGIVYRNHPTGDLAATNFKPVLENKQFEQIDSKKEVLFVEFPIVQTDLLLTSKGTPQFNIDEYNLSELYNEYFGYGLSSIVFQEIREARALAYSTYALYSNPTKKNKAHYLSAYVGTQPDKLKTALGAMTDILENMPVVNNQIDLAITSIVRRIQSDRILPRKYYWEYRKNNDRGVEGDILQKRYETIRNTSKKDLINFHQQYVKDRNYTLMVLGKKENLDLDYLNQFGPVKELSMEDIFGYK